MSEGFDVHEPAVAGFGVLCTRVREQLSSESMFIGVHAGATDEFTGVMAPLRGPVDAYAEAASRRLNDHAIALEHTATELTRTAWAYTGADKSAYTRFDPNAYPTSVTPEKEYKDFPDADHYPIDDPTGALTPPDISPPEIAGKVKKVGGALEVIDDVVKFVTGWSPVEAIVEPISGNWNALTAAGDLLIKTGNALDDSLANLTKGHKQLDAKWDGGAAQAFSSYLGKLVEGTDQEAALNRIVGEVYLVAADKVEKVADWVVSTLKSAVDMIGDRLTTAWIPIYGWYRAIDAVFEVRDLFDEAKAMVDALDKLIKDVESVIEFAKDPIGQTKEAAEGWLDEKLAPVRDKIDEYEKKAQIAADVAELSKVDDWTDTPAGGYRTGKNPRRPGAE